MGAAWWPKLKFNCTACHSSLALDPDWHTPLLQQNGLQDSRAGGCPVSSTANPISGSLVLLWSRRERRVGVMSGGRTLGAGTVNLSSRAAGDSNHPSARRLHLKQGRSEPREALLGARVTRPRRDRSLLEYNCTVKVSHVSMLHLCNYVRCAAALTSCLRPLIGLIKS